MGGYNLGLSEGGWFALSLAVWGWGVGGEVGVWVVRLGCGW